MLIQLVNNDFEDQMKLKMEKIDADFRDVKVRSFMVG